MLKTNIKHDAGLMSLALRLVVGWTYFSALYRRTILADKLDPEISGYIGEKFNHFLPHALGIKPIIQYLVTHPDLLWWAMVTFTIVEGIVGFMIMMGAFTRLMSVGVFGLAMGILLGSGWIGTTCLDEWQIGVLGIAAGFVLFLTGSGKYSMDHYVLQQQLPFTRKRWFPWVASGELPVKAGHYPKLVLAGSLAILGITLMTNQVFHGGLWGPLHNKSVKPKLEISAGKFTQKGLEFDVFRTEGVDVYGAWIIGMEIKNDTGKEIYALSNKAMSNMDPSAITNHYVAKVKPGKHSLVVPLGAKATIALRAPALEGIERGSYTLKITDISGASWKYRMRKE
ncbi:TQO small subunit DoxD [Echinicola vietnamensis]|uniref:TQO small subunit DoxD/TQO small subunit DoxA n=1 Tax=Echinicola vietnamensis (strain DSM 17526 / LMG 23754 / KMM 6221) TaxID=926556 RepID=L0G5C2_ECHVK|nr:TQO small subunit DoxD [Echinicola vietnamensis]AGA80216.1 TQO small subunit DoxD/TQO small subunit DoxA [Echinicola vietnamensis DSM 17526]